MKRYRIYTNGERFRIKTWAWYWPFWIYVKWLAPEIREIREWKTKEDAEQWIKSDSAKAEYLEKPWRPL